jgi:hypothetical protein
VAAGRPKAKCALLTMFDQVWSSQTPVTAGWLAKLSGLKHLGKCQVDGPSPAWPRAVVAGQGAGPESNTSLQVCLTLFDPVKVHWVLATLAGMPPWYRGTPNFKWP